MANGGIGPSFSDWLKEMKIEMTVREMLEAMDSARRRGMSVEQLLGYPEACRPALAAESAAIKNT